MRIMCASRCRASAAVHCVAGTIVVTLSNIGRSVSGSGESATREWRFTKKKSHMCATRPKVSASKRMPRYGNRYLFRRIMSREESGVNFGPRGSGLSIQWSCAQLVSLGLAALWIQTHPVLSTRGIACICMSHLVPVWEQRGMVGA